MSDLRVKFIKNTSLVDEFSFTEGGALGLGGNNFGTSGQVLTSQGSGSAPTWTTPSSSGVSVQVITSTGTYTPTSGKTNFLVYCFGAGGGGSASRNDNPSWGGGGGGCAWRVYNSTEMGSTFTITVGSGGAAGASGYAGSNGGSTTFDPSGTGVTLTGGGGSGGNYAGGAGGTATNGIQNWTGQAGDHPTLINSTHYLGRGGASLFHSYLGSNGGKGADANTGGSNISGNAGHNGCVVIFQY